MNPENHCAECGKTDVQPHPFYPPVEGACLCEDCGEDKCDEESTNAAR